MGLISVTVSTTRNRTAILSSYPVTVLHKQPDITWNKILPSLSHGLQKPEQFFELVPSHLKLTRASSRELCSLFLRLQPFWWKHSHEPNWDEKCTQQMSVSDRAAELGRLVDTLALAMSSWTHSAAVMQRSLSCYHVSF